MKKQFAILLIVCMLVSMLPITALAADKLPAPTIEWLTEDKTIGERQFKAGQVVLSSIPENIMPDYRVVIQNQDGEIFEEYSDGFGGETRSTQEIYVGWYTEKQLQSGTYTATIQYLGDGETYEDGEAVTSNEYVYMAPERQYETPTDVHWDNGNLAYTLSADVAADRSMPLFVQFALQMDDGSVQSTKATRYRASTVGDGNERFLERFNEFVTREGEGDYVFRIRVLSPDLTECGHSQWSEWSDVYHVTGAPKDTLDELQDINANLDANADETTKQEAIDRVRALNQNQLMTALAADNEGTGVAAELQELEETLGLDTSVTLAPDSGITLDTTQVTVVGAGLNAESLTVSPELTISKPTDELVIPDTYRNHVQMDLSLDHVATNQDGLLLVPIRISMPVPDGLNPQLLRILHYKDDGSHESIVPYIYQEGEQWMASFTVNRLSPFVFAEFVEETETTTIEWGTDGETYGNSGTLAELRAAINSLEDGGSIYVRMIGNMQLDTYLSAPVNKTVILDLAGHTLTASPTYDKFLIALGTLQLEDSSVGKTGTVTGSTNYCAVEVNAGATFIMNGGNITENHGGNRPGGVQLIGQSNFIMNGGAITNNTSNNVQAGVGGRGKKIEVSGTATITGNTGLDGACNLWLDTLNGTFLTIGEAGLDESARIGIYTNSRAFDFSKEFSTPYEQGKASAGNFISDSSNFEVKEADAANGQKQLILARPQAAAPTASAVSGTYHSTQKIELSTTTEGAKIYYTTDGTDPLTSQTRKAYTEPFTINKDTTVKAYAEWVQYNSPSDVAEFVYKIRRTSGSLTGGSSDTSTYSVTVPSDIENGAITVSPKNISSDSTVTITIEPDTGYVLDTLTVTDEDGKEISLTKKNDTEYTFEMPESDVEIAVSYKQGDHSCSSELFTDVNLDLWYHEALDYVMANDIMQGTSNTTFAPMENLSRGMMVQILYNLEGRPVVTEGSAFADVTTDAWYADAVTWAAAGSIVDGYNNSQYGPNDNITREQMIAMLYRYAQSKGYDTTQGGMAIREFDDYAAISAWALEAMTWAVNTGVINGNADNTLCPTAYASRAEVAQIIMNFCEKFAK